MTNPSDQPANLNRGYLTPQQLIDYGFPKEWITEETRLTLEELLTLRCDECHEVIERFFNAKWRLRLHAFRCDSCAEKLMEEYGCSWYDAKFVV